MIITSSIKKIVLTTNRLEMPQINIGIYSNKIWFSNI